MRGMPPARSRLQLPLLLLACIACAAPASAELAQQSSAVAGARFVGDDELGVGTPAAGGGFETTVHAFATDSQELGPTFAGDFSWEASFTGNGFVDYGHGEVELNAIATATPPSVESIPPGNPSFNSHNATFEGIVSVSFEEVGVVTGPAPGAPVTIEITVHSEGEGLVTRANGQVNTNTDVVVINNSAGFIGAEFFFFGPDTQTKTLAAAAGHEISVRGRYNVTAECSAGPPPPFAVTCSAQAANASTLVFGLPPGFGFDAPSGHDYTVAVPEPGQALLALTGALALAARRARRR